jgi:hypothetical protein
MKFWGWQEDSTSTLGADRTSGSGRRPRGFAIQESEWGEAHEEQNVPPAGETITEAIQESGEIPKSVYGFQDYWPP